MIILDKYNSIFKFAKDSDEVIFINRIIDRIERSDKNNKIDLTDFLDPGQISLVKCIANTLKSVNVYFDGGFEKSERKRAIVVPYSINFSGLDFQICTLKITTSKFSRELSHRDFLGSFVGLGIKRDMLGDILISDEGAAYIITTNNLKEFLINEFSKIGREQIKICQVDLEVLQGIIPKIDYIETNIIVTTMRLDSIVAAAFKLSRSTSANLINQKKVKVNFRIQESTHANIEQESIISVKGFGRCKIEKVVGQTKKERYILNVKIYE